MALTREQIAQRIALELRDGDYVNLGIGIPTLVANYVPKGIEVDGNGFVGTAVTAPAFSYLRPIESGNERLVDQTGIEPVTS